MLAIINASAIGARLGARGSGRRGHFSRLGKKRAGFLNDIGMVVAAWPVRPKYRFQCRALYRVMPMGR